VLRSPLILCFAAGLASATGFAPLDLWPVTLACFALLLHLVRGAAGMKAALLRGWLFGLGHFLMGLNWIAHAFTFQDAMPAWFGYGAVALVSLYLAVFPAVASGLAWRSGTELGIQTGAIPKNRSSRAQSRDIGALPRPSTSLGTNENAYSLFPFTLFFAAAWIVTEWLRATLFTGFAWSPLGVALVPAGWVPALARWIGTYGLSGVAVIAAGALLALAQRRWRPAAAGLLPLGILALLPKGPAELPRADAPLVRVVQPNIGQETKYDPAQDARNFQKLAMLSGTPGAEPRLLLWPEAAVPEYLDEDVRARERLAALLGPRDILLTGATKRYRRQEVKGEYIEEYTIGGRNSLFAMDARGRLLHRYDKSHLVPYGEYLPMRPLLSTIGLSRLVPGDIDFWPGPGPLSYPLPGFGKAGVQICYEIIFSGQVVDRADRPDFLFNPSNDAWFGSWGPPQHLAQARLRAIEEGIPVIRSTPTGISAVVDADGRVLNRLPHRTAGFIETHMPPAHVPTLFARLGNIIPLMLAIFLAALGVAMRRRAR